MRNHTSSNQNKCGHLNEPMKSLLRLQRLVTISKRGKTSARQSRWTLRLVLFWFVDTCGARFWNQSNCDNVFSQLLLESLTIFKHLSAAHFLLCWKFAIFRGLNKFDGFFALVSVSYLMYGPYGSFAPSYDSSRATITKEQSDLLYSTYGDDTGIHYAKRSVALKDTISLHWRWNWI